LFAGVLFLSGCELGGSGSGTVRVSNASTYPGDLIVYADVSHASNPHNVLQSGFLNRNSSIFFSVPAGSSVRVWVTGYDFTYSSEVFVLSAGEFRSYRFTGFSIERD